MTENLRSGVILALDVGKKRVGCAVSDDRQSLSLPLTTYDRTRGQAEREIIDLIKDKSVKLLVVGLPLTDDGQKTSECDEIERFSRRIARRTDIEVIYIDEQLTSVEAKQRLKEAGKAEKNAREKGMIDALAASIILQAYLDSLD